MYRFGPNAQAWVDPLGLAKKKIRVNYLKDYSDKNTKNFSAIFNSERDARSFARTKIGKCPIKVEENKFRSSNGKWQYRAKPDDLQGHKLSDTPHIHLEKIDVMTGKVIENWHLRWIK